MPYSRVPNYTDSIFFFWGSVAFAKGIDKSPAHDRNLEKMLAGKSNEEQLFIVHAWEAGWDAGRAMQRELQMERRCYLNKPPARLWPQRSGSQTKDET